MREYLPKLRPFAKARELLLRLRADGVRLVVATSAGEEEMQALVKVANIEDLLDDQTSSSDAKNSKPDPDIISAALKRARANPDEAWMLGDTPYDVEAARRAGVQVIALRSGGWKDEQLTGATAIYENVAELLALYESSPLAQSSPRK
ncbi:MAG TPA: HAD family hydrolase [Polyangiaceae bacterium]|nr:HAD family hydrolase [Polyangiaceae bacterium]